MRNNGAQRTILPEGSLVHGSQTIPLAFPTIALAPGATATATATALVAEPALWSPAAPNLYTLQLAVPGESSYSARVGLRQVSWHGQELLLNGQRLRLHGATIQEDVPGHGDALTPADQDGIVADLKAIGANAVRAQHPLDPALLERLDAAGLLVWQGVGPVEGAGMWYWNSARLEDEAEQQVLPRPTRRCTRRSSRGTWWTRSRATAATPRRSVTSATRRIGCTHATRAAWSRWTSGAGTRRGVPARSTRKST